ncbi:hypothetical protein ACIQRS_09030 [Streptomyces termitum]|uniref:Uncharacterized protein n=1 Tax=Streptomyces termitum TaxID=67368 RepID=A0A918SQD5_9ACTN|nr:hypothetical protein [Streptomyces termitum]GHA63783.1 hypothetical protein GCM10010305_01500 [Streptomyces termitum]
MSRTAHHLTRAAWDTEATDGTPPGSPWHALTLYDLRYASRTEGPVGAPAATDRVRPTHRVHRVRRHVAVHWLPRHQHDPAVGRWAARLERRARQDLRARLGAVRRLARTPGGPLDLDAADTVDVPPARHRHGARWLA